MNTPSRLRSHFIPNLYLKTHIKQVKTAAEFIFERHPQETSKCLHSLKVLRAMVACHDLGKGSPAFQKYIENPKQFTEDPRTKEHTALSAALTLLWAKKEKWDAFETLTLLQGVAGHHHGFYTLEELECRLYCDEEDLNDPKAFQWSQLDRQILSQETGLDLSSTQGSFEDGRKWLFDQEDVKLQLSKKSLTEQLRFRLYAQFLCSILLEADKAFLALHEDKLRKEYLYSGSVPLSFNKVEQYLAQLAPTRIDPLRNEIRVKILENLEKNSHSKLFTLTLPTGTGKTSLATSWALKLREKISNNNLFPQIIIVLPYLSIIDQTEHIYRKILELEQKIQNEILLTSHSISERHYELEGKETSQTFSEFFIDTWRSEIILTTFDQFLFALFSEKSKHQMRFHHLMDALIIFDEIQTLPCSLWDPLDQTLNALVKESNTRILFMSATQPAFLSNALELAGTPSDIQFLFEKFSRYEFHFHHKKKQLLSEFIDSLQNRLSGWILSKMRILITLNTRKTAREVWEFLDKNIPKEIPLFLITADVTPRHRLQKISEIKKNLPCFVVSTQCIEAGVDIDMDYVIRDFAPLDSLIQIAGRCNRNQLKPRGIIEVIQLISNKRKSYAEQIYRDGVHLNVTSEILEKESSLLEENIFPFAQRYFNLLKQRKDCGEKTTQSFAKWEEIPDIRESLRGASFEQIDFLILDQSPEDEELYQKICEALDEEDRWKRRSALRTLAGSIQQRTVSIYGQKGFYPQEFAQVLCHKMNPYFFLLKKEYYSLKSGITLPTKTEESLCII